MAELAASVGNQLMHVDYDNNKHDYSNDNNGIHYSSARRVQDSGGGVGGGASGGPGCLLDLNPNDFQSAESCAPVRVGLSVAAVDQTTPRPDDDESAQLTVMSCDASSNTPCARCGLQLRHHHLHHHHHGHQPPQQQQPSLVYGQFCADELLNDDRYPVGLRTPQ